MLLQPGTTTTDAGPMDAYRVAAAESEQSTSKSSAASPRSSRMVTPAASTVANPDAPWRYLLGDGVVIRPLPVEFPRGETYLAWRVDRDRADDLAPILRVARERSPNHSTADARRQ